jgi:hypothetical protein
MEQGRFSGFATFSINCDLAQNPDIPQKLMHFQTKGQEKCLL